jgi:ring-1,2-phenylacetyl-CoA epoxidase subunit PaaE
MASSNNYIMANQFHPLKVIRIQHETSYCVSVSFLVPNHLKEQFQFREGQYLTLRKQLNGEEVRRSYSICSAPHEQELKVAIKKVPGGIFSSFAVDQLKEQDQLDVMLPEGKFTARLSDKAQPHYLAIAAGSGITPILSIIKHTLHTQPESRFTLIYGNQNRGSIIFFEAIEELKNRYMNRLTLINVLSREKTDAEIFHGRIDETKLEQLAKLVDYACMQSVYLCGPEVMILKAKDFLIDKGLASKNIHFELFTTGAMQAKRKEAVVDTDDGPKSQVTIRLDGRTFSFDLSMKGKNILDAALTQGADLPFACKGGVCCTCRAKLLEGKVSMDVNYALEKEEVEQGFILTCQSHPLTEKVVIDFDEK